ncbi:hypothetical protein ACKUSY_02330 [Myroides odoratus]
MKKLYILIFFFYSIWGIAQETPGGVSNVQIELWLRADESSFIQPEDGIDIDQWMDHSGLGRHFGNTSGFLPRFVKSAMNFHSAIEFYYDEDIPSPTVNNLKRKLESDANFQASRSKSYFVIWVSRLNNELYSGNNTAVTFSLGNLSNNDFGWQAGTGTNMRVLWHQTRSDPYSHSTETKTYGVGMALIPNVTGGLTQDQILNGLKSTTAMRARYLNERNDVMVIGNSDSGSVRTENFFGEVMEIIVLSRPAGTSGVTLSAAEINKINTHLGLKYGIGLESAQPHYMLSDNTLVFNGLDAGYTGYNKDVFGLVRDDESGLYQKQAMSTDRPSLVVSLGSFRETNAENTGTMPDKHALLFGANGLKENSTYDLGPGTQFMNYTLQTAVNPETGVSADEKLTTLYNYKLRAKTTGATSYTINAKLALGGWLLVSQNPNFIPSQTNIYKTEDGVIKNLVINDGDYIGFASNFVAPGGVTNGLRMWLNASNRKSLTLDSRGEIVNWEDNAGLGTSYRKRLENNSGPLYLKGEERTNYHPTPLYRKWQDYLVTDKAAMSKAIPDDVAFYAVVNHDFNAADRSYFIGFGQQTTGTNARRPSFGVYRGGSNNVDGLGRIGSTGLHNSPSRLFNAGATTIAGYHWKVGSGVTFEFDGGHSEYVSHTHKNVLMNGPGMLGLGSSSKNYNLFGVMPEVILYEKVLTQNEKDRINSYLGLKYAITIKLGTSASPNFNYVLSDNTSIWDGNSNPHKAYHNNVASVVRDDDMDLYNAQAKSTDVGSIVHMGVGTKLGDDPQLGFLLHDDSAITWGHNNGSLATYSFAGNEDICGAMDSRLGARIWLVDNTNFDQSILVRTHNTGVFPYNGPNWQVFMLVADSPNKLISNNWDQVIEMKYIDGGHQANYKFPKDQLTYITFAAKTLPGICESCEFSGVKMIDFTKATWTKGQMNKTFNLGDGFTADVNVSVESPSSMKSHYPRPSSYRSLREYRRRGTGDQKMVTEVVLKQNGNLKAAASSFEIFEVDRLGRRYTNIEVYGVCGEGIVHPKLSYVATRSSYTIEMNKAKGHASSGYASKKGRMYVEFDVPVEKIYVVHTYTGKAGSGAMRMGVGPMEFYCLPPAPEPNEEGLIFTKQGPPEMLLCEEATYSFRITNTNCAPYLVNFSDVLPAGMKWETESLSIDSTAIAQATINTYGQTSTLKIDNLEVPGVSTLTFRAKAIFDLDAQEGVYENRGKLSYSPVLQPTQTVELLSCDRLSTGCEPTRTHATGVPGERPLPIEVVSFKTDKACYTEDNEIEVAVTVKNPNAFALNDMMLEFNYNEEFTYKANSITSPTISLGSSVTIDTSEVGSVSIEDFVLPEGEHTIKFKIKAPNEAGLVMEDIDPTNPTLGQIESPLFIDFEMVNESDDVCLNTITAEVSGSLEIEYCTVCYYDPVIGDGGDILDSNGYLAITSLNRPDKTWIPTRGNAFMVLESKTKGFVVSRLTTTQIMQLSPIAGMLVYDTTVNCLKMFNGTAWGCLEQGCVDE